MNPETLSDQTLANQRKIQYIADQLKVIDPAASDEWLANVAQQQEDRELTKEFSKPYEPSGINPEFNIVRRLASKAAYGTGYFAGEQARKAQEFVQPLQKTFERFTPDALKNAGNTFMSSTEPARQQFGQLLTNLADAPDSKRNAALFIMQQQPQYQSMMKEALPEEQKTPTARNKNISGTTGQ